jgi:hypothetical protein
MTLAGRIGHSFTNEFKRPQTQIFLLASCLFLVGSAIEVNHHWTATTRPFWIGLLLCISPIAMVPTFYPTTTWKSDRRRILVGLSVAATSMLAFYSLERTWPQVPVWIWVCLELVEVGVLLWVLPKWLGESPEQADSNEGSKPCL